MDSNHQERRSAPAKRGTHRRLSREPWDQTLDRARLHSRRSAPTCDRRSLYMPALVAARFNPDLKAEAEYAQLPEAGKPAKVALDAIMRRRIVLANALQRPTATGRQKSIDQNGYSGASERPPGFAGAAVAV